MTVAEEYQLSEYRELMTIDSKQQVFLVRHQITGRMAVKKVIDAGQQEIYEFLRDHPNTLIPGIDLMIRDGDRLMIVEEYVEGRTLTEVVSEQMLKPETVLQYTLELCRGLMPLHEACPPIICRDIKPDNVMVTGQGQIKLIDFNIARQVVPGKSRDTTLLGTAGYAAPEQFGFGQTDQRTDIYAIGVLMNYMLTGKQISEELSDSGLLPVIRKCVQIDPDNRYENLRDLYGDLYAYLPGGRYRHLLSEHMPVDVGRNAKTEQIRSWLPPGFRSLQPVKMILSGMLYAALIALCTHMNFQYEDGTPYAPLQNTETQAAVFLVEFLTILVMGNYRGIRGRIPVLRSRHIWIRIPGYAVLNFLLLILAAGVLILLGV